MHLPTPVQRWTASVNEPESWVSLSVVRTGRMGAARRRSESNGAGSTSTPGLSRLPGSRIRLACCIRAIACGEYIRGSSSERARPSPCSPDIEPPYDATRSAASSMKCRNRPAPAGVLELEVDAHVHAAVAEVAVGDAVEPAVLEQRVEVAQVGAELLRRDRGVLPARLRRAAQRAGREPGAVLADPPQRELLDGVGDDPVRHAGSGAPPPAPATRPPPRRRR